MMTDDRELPKLMVKQNTLRTLSMFIAIHNLLILQSYIYFNAIENGEISF